MSGVTVTDADPGNGDGGGRIAGGRRGVLGGCRVRCREQGGGNQCHRAQRGELASENVWAFNESSDGRYPAVDLWLPDRSIPVRRSSTAERTNGVAKRFRNGITARAGRNLPDRPMGSVREAGCGRTR